MYALRALPLGHTAVMCTEWKLNCCDGLSSLDSISCDATRVDHAVKVIPLPPGVPFSQAEDLRIARDKKFKEKEDQWASLHEAWLQEKRAWEGSRKALILEISRLQVQSQSLKESIQNPFPDKDVDALTPLVQAVVALLVKEGGERTLQTRLTPRKWEATLRPACSAQAHADLLAVRNRCISDSTVDALDSCVAGAEIPIMEASEAHLIDGMSCVVDHAAESFSDRDEMIKVVTGETSEGEGGRTECAESSSVMPYLSDRDEMLEVVPGETSEGEGERTECSEISSVLPYFSGNNSGPSDVQTSNGTGVLEIDDQRQLGKLRLKELNVHSYVHNALKASHMRWWLKNRVVDETP